MQVRYCGLILFCSFLVFGCATKDAQTNANELKKLPPQVKPIRIDSRDQGMKCTEVIRGRSEYQAFFGFFHDLCLDPFGDPYVYITGYDYLDGESPAKKYGIKIKDRIVGFNGCFVRTSHYLKIKMENFTALNAAIIDVLREGKTEKETAMVSTKKLTKFSEGVRKRCVDIGLSTAN